VAKITDDDIADIEARYRGLPVLSGDGRHVLGWITRESVP
jgi:hypothetical protein